MTLSAADLTRMRGDANAFLPDTCDIVRKTSVSDGQGGFVDTYAVVESAVSCRVKVTDRAPDELVRLDRAQNTLKYTVTFAHDRELESTDRVIWNAKTLEVIAAIENSLQIHKIYFCVRVT